MMPSPSRACNAQAVDHAMLESTVHAVYVFGALTGSAAIAADGVDGDLEQLGEDALTLVQG